MSPVLISYLWHIKRWCLCSSSRQHDIHRDSAHHRRGHYTAVVSADRCIGFDTECTSLMICINTKNPKKHDVTLPSYGRITSGVRSRTALAASLFDIKHHLSMQTPHLSAVLLYLTVFYTKAINFAFNGRAAGTSAITGSTCPRYMIWQCACMKLIFHLLHNHAWQNGIFPSFVFTIIVYTREEKHVYIGMIN